MSKSLIDDRKGEIVLTDKLSEDFASLLLSENYSDVTFLIDKDRIPGKYALPKFFFEKLINSMSFGCLQLFLRS